MMLAMRESKPRSADIQTEKIQSRCVPALADELEAVRRVLIRDPYSLKHKGQRVGVGPLLCAIVSHFLAQSEGEQHRIADEGIRAYEAMEDEATARLSSDQEAASLPATRAEPPRSRPSRSGDHRRGNQGA
jgi:hypothetical protein